ncbi:MAG TPA: hypothetical protein VED46_17000 [Alphaproteobacteria bacterium]|nr:hypothetical protein [Alphaproteobacteria bacterium]
MRTRGTIAAISALMLLGATGAEASCPARPSPPSCLNKNAPFAPAEQAECVGRAQRYFSQNDKHVACLREEAERAEKVAREARSRLACRSTTKRPC